MEPPDAQEQRIRFGCGFVAGFFCTAISSISFALANGYYVLAAAVAMGVLFGFAAMKQGDAFWDKFRIWWWW